MKKGILFAVITILAMVVLVGTVSIAAGAPGGSDNDAKEDQSPKYEASITVDQDAVDGLSEKEEIKVLAPKAKISADQARAAAEAAVKGDVTETELGNENGALVYEVEIGNQEVKVDAGNGNILHIEKDDDDSEESGAED